MKKAYINLDFACPCCKGFIHLEVFHRDLKQLMKGKIEVVPIETTGYY